MTDSKHTPGPWKVGADRRVTEVWAVDPTANDRHIICECEGPDRKANVHLITAAPDLLEAVHKVVNNWGDLHHKDLMMLRAAIAKAEDPRR